MRYPESYDTAVASWVRQMESDHLAPRTVSFYVETLHAVAAILQDGGRPIMPRQIRREDLDYLLDYMEIHNFASQTRKGYIQSLKKWVSAFDSPLSHAWPRVRYPFDKRPNVDWLTADEARQLLSCSKTPLQSLVIHLELCLGLRRVEVIRLRVQDVDWAGEYLRVTGKGPAGGSPRLVPWSHDTKHVLESWMSLRAFWEGRARARYPVHSDIPDNLIVWRRSDRLYPYSEEGYGLDKTVINPLRKKLGISFSNHTLRRTFGRTLYRAGAPVPTIARILGHESTDVTLRYIGVDMDDMREAMERVIY